MNNQGSSQQENSEIGEHRGIFFKKQKFLSDVCLAEMRQGIGFFTDTLWQDEAFDDDVAYAVVDSRTESQVGVICHSMVIANFEEDVIYRIHPFAN